MRDKHLLSIFAFTSFAAIALALDSTDHQDGIPQKKLISTFQIVRFPNDACVGTSSRNGTCYTSAECSDKGGTSSGSCADGFGVCCTFVITECGKTSSENITYWDGISPTLLSTTQNTNCKLTICPINNNICQLRIDFTMFVITGPSTSTLSEAHHQYGVVPGGLGVNGRGAGAVDDTESSWKTNCLTDTFSISSVSTSNSPPVLCGTNSGTHMYVDANVDSCNMLNFNMAPLPGPAAAVQAVDSRGVSAIVARDWDMTIYQLECGHVLAAPPGCTQYIYNPGVNTGQVQSYNFGTTSVHLANQNHKICIRRERTRCYACFSMTNGVITDFEVSGRSGGATVYTMPGQACGYGCEVANGIGNAANQCGGYDCVIIPGAFVVAIQATGAIQGTSAANIQALTAANYQTPVGPQMSGGGAFGPGVATNVLTGLAVAGDGTTPTATVCTKHVPFQLTFKSDGFEGTGVVGEHVEAVGAGQQAGVRLNYELISCA